MSRDASKDPHEPHAPNPLKATQHVTASSILEPAAPGVLQRGMLFASQPVVASFIAGGVAGAVSRTVVSPLGEKTSSGHGSQKQGLIGESQSV